MSNIYVNVETGKKISLKKIDIVRVFDHEDWRDVLDFTDTAEGVASWCMENLFGDEDNIESIHEAFENEKWLDVIELTQCRNCNYEVKHEWIVEEMNNEQ